MNHDQRMPLLQPGQLFQRLFAGFRANFRLLYSLIGHLRVNHYQEPITFGRIFSSLKRLVVRLLVLPGWPLKDAMPPPSTPTPPQERENVTEQVAVVVPEKKIRKKALLIGIKQVREKEPEGHTGGQDCKPKRPKSVKKSKVKAEGKKREGGTLLNSHRDVEDMRRMLEELYNYAPEDILTLIDDDDPNHLQPTKINMVTQMRKLVENAKDGDRFFFHYSGHSDQHDTDDKEEEDGKNEYIITCDGEEIMDDELRSLLVDPLPPTCTLIAVLDSCHSCSLLDLVHFRCNRVYVPWLNKGKRRTDTHWGMNTRKQARVSTGPGARSSSRPAAFLTELITSSMRGMAEQLQAEDENSQDVQICIPDIIEASKKNFALTIHTSIPENVRFIDSPASSRGQYDSPVTIYCDGNCRRDRHWKEKDSVPRADVVCLSSSKDSQRSWEDANGNSMTQYLIRILRKDPRRTLREVLTLVSHDIHKYYVDMHESAKHYKKDIRAINEDRVAKGKGAVQGADVEMHNFQDPQLSSHHPLDMDRLFAL